MNSSANTFKLRIRTDGPRHPGGVWPDWYEGLRLVGINSTTGEEITFFKGNWELQGILDWLKKCEEQIRGDSPVIPQLPGETIGQTLARSYEIVTEDLPDEVFDLAISEVNRYNLTHNLAIGASRMDQFPDLLLGRSADGHEISNWIDDTEHSTAWRYLFDIDDFYRNLPVEDEQ
ncbi:hypothetical protein [Gordonia jacobaea]|uniref:hypothetical protein n=1 Tax=Gordonia jacobaea TaxID=122202 RepID=UPI003D7461F5